MTTPATRWVPPEPRQLPELRADLLDYYDSDLAYTVMREALRGGQSTIVPAVPGTPAPPAEVGAQILVESERHRLASAVLFSATADMTALALAAAATPPIEPVSMDRPPTTCGFMVFDEPIGGYTEDVGAALAGTLTARPGVTAMLPTPIVAVSWSLWDPHTVQAESGPVQWSWRQGGGQGVVPGHFQGIWLTFYSPSGLLSGLPADTVIASMGDGSKMTAGMIDQARRVRRGPALQWDNESVLARGVPLAPAVADTTGAWANVVYTAWQLMAEDGRTRWTETEQIPRARSGAKRDARQGVTGPGAVRVVRVHTAHRPARQAAADDAAASTGRREPQWSCRWPVRPHRRDHCMNPGKHAAGDCAHEDRLIPGHVKGPKGKPLRTGSTVHLWDHQPDAAPRTPDTAD